MHLVIGLRHSEQLVQRFHITCTPVCRGVGHDDVVCILPAWVQSGLECWCSLFEASRVAICSYLLICSYSLRHNQFFGWTHPCKPLLFTPSDRGELAAQRSTSPASALRVIFFYDKSTMFMGVELSAGCLQNPRTGAEEVFQDESSAEWWWGGRRGGGEGGIKKYESDTMLSAVTSNLSPGW